MRNYRHIFMLCFCFLSLTLASCGSSDEIETPSQEQDGAGQQGGGTEGGEQGGGEQGGDGGEVVPPVALELNLDLEGRLNRPTTGLGLQFPEQVSAVAQIREVGSRKVLSLPVGMTRNPEGELSAETLAVDFGEEPASPDRKWEIRLLTGGVWQAGQHRILFPETLDPIVGERLTQIEFQGPAFSEWVAIPTDESGRFVADDEGRSRMILSLEPRGRIVEHHIEKYELRPVMTARSGKVTVRINSLAFASGKLSFGGWFDLGEESADDPRWMAQAMRREVSLHTPITSVDGEVGKGDYLYFWAMPSGEETLPEVSVEAWGEVEALDKEPFEALEIFAGTPRAEGLGLGIGSTPVIEYHQKVEGPITLEADKPSIMADGMDRVTFRVMQAGVDVTAQSRIYLRESELWDDELKDNTFTTKRVKTYCFFAKKDSERSDYLYIKAVTPEVVGPDGEVISGRVFCPNVTLESGWYDVNKVGDGNSYQDGLLCWAAAASNMLQWWLDDFKAKGHEIPSTVPYGPGSLYRLAIFDTFFNIWENYMHSTKPAIRWFMQGGAEENSSSNSAKPDKTGVMMEGGYFRGVLPPEQEAELFASDYVTEYGAYSNWDTEVENTTRHERFSRLLLRLFKKGPSALSIDSHELTAWGCEVQDGLVVKVYVTNSDGGGNEQIKGYTVEDRGGWMHLSDYPGKTSMPTQIIRLTGLTAYGL